MPPGATPQGGTRPESLESSHKRTRGPNLYQYPLPLLPASPSFISSLLSLLPSLSLTPSLIQAIYDTLTKTIWVQDPEEMNNLWRHGFFGKGSLSRSDPSWRRRVQNRIAEAEGTQKNLTSEELTALRRIERKGHKQLKKLEREAEKLQQANAALGRSEVPSVTEETPSSPSASTSTAKVELQVQVEPEPDAEPVQTTVIEAPPLWHLDAEHTQLQPEEAFFLLFSLGTLSLRTLDPLQTVTSTHPSSSSTYLHRPLSILQAWRTFLLDYSTLIPSTPTPVVDPRLTRLDSPFLLAYATYHHYRSMGWVVRSGAKFCTDWVLYGPQGPVGGHAEYVLERNERRLPHYTSILTPNRSSRSPFPRFAVLIYPNYVNPQDALANPFRSTLSHSQIAEGEHRSSWRWLHTANRVCSGVKKTLVLLQVLIPSMEGMEDGWVGEDPARALSMLQMREVVVKRFSPGRMRD
ncbi:BQ5605_C021g09341 [Microbotryum silenes-dioicae]|uniref:tRNA-splicing endonuclease subunit Sen2 n=1 Tax=Microbotryum silenes-dioicae TaxID=796604 RepID=A0A2X0PE73_9BASI|nr:BQ5605_C021g09341 [Microbotryum silenes-dioicae]